MRDGTLPGPMKSLTQSHVYRFNAGLGYRCEGMPQQLRTPGRGGAGRYRAGTGQDKALRQAERQEGNTRAPPQGSGQRRPFIAE
ncbi:hypothetical protein E2C01_049614 [Portunus trituberculatus]|uniref:Uncharacterized protein n=1 Tax=Portunus trituberculatus TaxID=210409 RepID=A0A5B7G6W0_PORTR|nr:hypothetical protein [Portunus trituberculatus]